MCKIVVVIVALSLIMVLCLLVYRLAEYRLWARLAEAEQTIPDQVQKPTARPTIGKTLALE